MQSYGIYKVLHQRMPQLHCTQDEKWQKSFFPWAIFFESYSVCWKNWGSFISFICIPEVVKTIPMHLVIDVALQTDFSLHPPPPYSSISTSDGWRSVCIAHSLVALVLCWIAPLPHLVKCRCLWQSVDSIQLCAWHPVWCLHQFMKSSGIWGEGLASTAESRSAEASGWEWKKDVSLQ